MAQVVVEQLESRSISDQSGPKTGERAFWVYDDTTTLTLPSQIVFADGTLPGFGEVFPGEDDIFATYYTVNPVPDSGGTWEVRWTYTPGVNEELPETDPQAPGFIEWSVEYSGVFKDAWRTGPNLWTPQYNGVDIGGKPVDQAGNPLSYFVPQHRLVVTETIMISQLLARQGAIAAAVGTRNTDAFQGAAAGTLLYEGASGTRTGALVMQLTHRFLYDRYLHAEQRPSYNVQGDIETIEIQTVRRAKTVRWEQPFPSTTDFGSLSDNF